MLQVSGSKQGRPSMAQIVCTKGLKVRQEQKVFWTKYASLFRMDKALMQVVSCSNRGAWSLGPTIVGWHLSVVLGVI